MDYSDQIFTVGSQCLISTFFDFETYRKLSCHRNYSTPIQINSQLDHSPGKVKITVDFCQNSIGFLSTLQSNADWELMQEYRDPHNCTGSCEYPEDGCYACTNPEYFFCEKNNVSVCMHPALECDGHPQCDDAEDENLDQCFQKYKEREIITSHATLKCPSRNYPEMTTVS